VLDSVVGQPGGLQQRVRQRLVPEKMRNGRRRQRCRRCGEQGGDERLWQAWQCLALEE